MTDPQRYTTALLRFRHYWPQRRFLKNQLKKCLHPSLAKLFFNSLLSSHRSLNEIYCKKKPLAQLSWCLIIGANGSGKSSLLDNSGLNLQAPEGLNSRYQPMANRGMPRFRHNNHKIFVELPTYFFINESVKHIPYLTYLIDFLSFFNYLPKIREIIYTISLDNLLNDSEAEHKKIDELFASLTLLASKIPQTVQCHIVITKIDRLLGFNEFFDDLSVEERQLACGTLLTPHTVNTTFQKQFHHLVRRLTERLFWRCHSEHQLQRRLLVADFPQQFLQQEKLLSPYLNRFEEVSATAPAVSIKSLYWVSAVQQGPLLDLLRRQAVELLQTPTNHCLPLLLQRKAFFIRGFFQHLHLAEPIRPKPLPNKTHPALPAIKKTQRNRTRSIAKKYCALLLIPLFIFVGFNAYENHLSTLPIANLQQDPALAYALATANNPSDALQAYILHVVPDLSNTKQQALLTDPQVKAKIQTAANIYLNQTWQEHIVRYAEQNLKAYFPLDPHAKKDADLKPFTAFYGPGGLVDHFHETYLSTLLNSQQVHLTPEAQQFFTTVKTLQALLFNSDGQLVLSFSLSPSLLSNAVRRFDLSLSGTLLSVKAHTITNKSFTWPNSNNLNQAGYVIQRYEGVATSVNFPGPWAWLHLLQQFHLNDFTKDNHSNYSGNLLSSDASVQLALSSQQNIAAMLPLLTHLTVPTHIL